MGAEAGELLHVHEAVLEDRLADARGALGPRHQGHELRLQVGREARERVGRDVDGLRCRCRCGARGCPRSSPPPRRRLCPRIARAYSSRSGRVFSRSDVAAGHGDGHGVGAGLDPVGQHLVASRRRAAARRRRRSCDVPAPSIRAPILIEAIGEVGDLRLAGGVLDHRRAVREASPPSARHGCRRPSPSGSGSRRP